METLSAVLPIVIDLLVAGLLVALIVLIIKIIGVIDDARLLIDNVVDKVNTLNGLFNIIEKIDMGVNGVAKRVIKIFEGIATKMTGRSSDDDTSEEENELEEILKGRE